MKIKFLRPFRLYNPIGDDMTMDEGAIDNMEKEDYAQWLIDNGFAEEVDDRVGLDGKLVCPNCGKEMPRILVDMFMWDGSDENILTDYTYEHGAICFWTGRNWTGYELQADDTDIPSEEVLETISCPFCLKSFKSDYISISEPLEVVLSIKDSGEKEDEQND